MTQVENIIDMKKIISLQTLTKRKLVQLRKHRQSTLQGT